jgi:hypothetical protein
MATINIGELATTTLRHRNKELADNITNHNVLLKVLEQKGNIRTCDGGRDIVEELMYAENGTVMWYDGYDTLDVTPGDVIDAATFDFKQLAATVSMSGREQIQNSGKERIINWLDKKIQVAEISMRNTLASSLYSDGTTSNQIGGLRYLVADDPTASSTVGGINQSTYSFWRNKTRTEGADNTIQTGMNLLWLDTLRGTDHADLIVFDSAYYAAFEATLQTLQRFQDADLAKLGFDNLAYKSAKVVYDENVPSGRGYFLNTDYIYLRPHKDRQFVTDDRRESFNQDAFVIPILWAGNLTCSNRSLQGLLETA